MGRMINLRGCDVNFNGCVTSWRSVSKQELGYDFKHAHKVLVFI